MGSKRPYEGSVTYEAGGKSALCGPGVKKTAREKDFLLHINANIKSILLRGGFDNMSQSDIFEAVTDLDRNTLTPIRKEIKDNGNVISDDKKPGPKPRKIEFEFDWFIEWLNDKVSTAKKGGFLTIQNLQRDLHSEAGVQLSRKLLRRTLLRMGFVYCKRAGRWTSRRNSPDALAKLRLFLEFVYENTEWVEDDPAVPDSPGKWRWKIPLGYEDESFEHESAFRKESWSHKTDKTYDFGRCSDRTISILDAIFSFGFATSCRKAWPSTQKKH